MIEKFSNYYLGAIQKGLTNRDQWIVPIWIKWLSRYRNFFIIISCLTAALLLLCFSGIIKRGTVHLCKLMFRNKNKNQGFSRIQNNDDSEDEIYSDQHRSNWKSSTNQTVTNHSVYDENSSSDIETQLN